MSELKPWEIQYFRSGGFINKDYDMARIYKDLPIIEGRRLLKELNTRPDLKAELVRAEKLCELYFNIAAEAIGEDEVRRLLVAKLNTIMGESEP